MQSFWNQIGNDISGMVKIHRIDQPVMPLLPPEQQYFLRENIKTNLLMARISLLRRDSQSYRESLEQARQWIKQYFAQDKRSTQWILSEIDSLAGINPAPELPDISDSLAGLQRSFEEK